MDFVTAAPSGSCRKRRTIRRAVRFVALEALDKPVQREYAIFLISSLFLASCRGPGPGSSPDKHEPTRRDRSPATIFLTTRMDIQNLLRGQGNSNWRHLMTAERPPCDNHFHRMTSFMSNSE